MGNPKAPSLPQALKVYADKPKWVGYPLIPSQDKHHGGADGAGGSDKPPVNPHTCRGARTNHPEDLGTFNEAAACVGKICTVQDKKTKQFVSAMIEGVGLVLEGTGIICLDLDEVRNKETGAITPEAQEIVQALSTAAYIEVSPSGKGLHALLKGEVPAEPGISSKQSDKPDALGGRTGEYQLLKKNYCTVTGNALPGCASGLDPAQPFINELWERFFRAPIIAKRADNAQAQGNPSVVPSQAPLGAQAPAQAAAPNVYTPPRSAPSAPLTDFVQIWQSHMMLMSDDEILDAIFAAGAHGQSVKRAFYGDYSWLEGDGSQSVGDWFVARALIEYTQDVNIAKRLFMKSDLYREEKLDYLFSRAVNPWPAPRAGHIEFTPEEKRAYAQAHGKGRDEPLPWDYAESHVPGLGDTATGGFSHAQQAGAQSGNQQAPQEARSRIEGVEEPDPAELLRGDLPIFITGTHNDAKAFTAAGVPAIALEGFGSTGLLSLIGDNGEGFPVLILALENSANGAKGSRQLAKVLEAIPGLRVYRPQLSELFGNCTNAWQAGDWFPGFDAAVAKCVTDSGEQAKKDAEQEYNDYFDEQARYEEEHLAAISDMTPRIETHIPSLDKALGGGLKPWLYILGAISSLGKSTLAGQICDNIAMDPNGRDVLIFTLEMRREDMFCKAVARLLAEKRAKANGINDTTQAHEIDRILTGSPSAAELGEGWSRKTLSKEVQQEISQAEHEYFSKIRGRLWIFEGRQSIDDITRAVDKHIRLRRRKNAEYKPPVVLIDYVQILAPCVDENGKPVRYVSDMQKINDDAFKIGELTRIQHVPVIAISSFNRDNYYAPADLTALKGSGNLEYDADVVIAAQYYAVKYATRTEPFNIREERKRRPREIELSIIKGRGAPAGDGVRLFYASRYDYFMGTNAVFECEKEHEARDSGEEARIVEALLEAAKDEATPLDDGMEVYGDLRRFCLLSKFLHLRKGTIPGRSSGSASDAQEGASSGSSGLRQRRGRGKSKKGDAPLGFEDVIVREEK